MYLHILDKKKKGALVWFSIFLAPLEAAWSEAYIQVICEMLSFWQKIF